MTTLDPQILDALAAIDANPRVTVGDLAGRLRMSPRVLAARFRRATGVAPKQYAQIQRFHQLIDALQAVDGWPDWAHVAAETATTTNPTSFARSGASPGGRRRTTG